MNRPVNGIRKASFRDFESDSFPIHLEVKNAVTHSPVLLEIGEIEKLTRKNFFPKNVFFRLKKFILIFYDRNFFRYQSNFSIFPVPYQNLKNLKMIKKIFFEKISNFFSVQKKFFFLDFQFFLSLFKFLYVPVDFCIFFQYFFKIKN